MGCGEWHCRKKPLRGQSRPGFRQVGPQLANIPNFRFLISERGSVPGLKGVAEIVPEVVAAVGVVLVVVGRVVEVVAEAVVGLEVPQGLIMAEV